MNAKKNMNTGWILCPSKTFPGKFYYFNVQNGETAWSLGDVEKNILKKNGGIPKVTGTHHHPEPTSPPTVDTNIHHSTLPSFSLRHPTSVFGQSVFPKPLPCKSDETNVIWTPIHIQVPIVLAPEKRIQSNVNQVCGNLSTVNQGYSQGCGNLSTVNQACTIQSNLEIVKPYPVTEAKEMFVHTCNKPLSQRFINYEKPVINFDKNNKIEDNYQFEKFYTSTPYKNSPFKTDVPNTLFQSKSNLSFSNLNPKVQNKLIKEQVFNIELPSNAQEKVCDTQLKSVPKGDGNKADIALTESRLNYSGSDLRMLIMAKRKKTQDLGVNNNTGEIISNKMKTVSQAEPKKRVTFHLDYEDISITDNEDEDLKFKEKYSTTVNTLKALGSGVRNDIWWIVVDAEVLLSEFTFLESFVQIDRHCKLVIPASAHALVKEASRGRLWEGEGIVERARHVLRRIPNANTIVQSSDEEIPSAPNDGILNSCIEAIDRNIHAILITNDQELLTTAKCYGIHCFNIQNIKNGLELKPKAFGYKQMKITIHNDTDASFIQNGAAIKHSLNLKDKEGISKVNEKLAVPNEHLKIVKNSMITNENSTIPTENLRITKENSRNPFLNTSFTISSMKNSLISNESSNKSKQNSSITYTSSTYPKNTMVSNENSKISKKNSLIAMEHSTIMDNSKTIPLNSNANNNSILNENSIVFDTKALTTEWRYTASDITETTIDVDMQNLNIKEKYQQKTPDKNTTNKQETNEHLFQKPTPKIDFQKFKNTTNIHNGGQFFDCQKDRAKPFFESKTNETRSVFEMGKDSNSSKFEFDLFKIPLNVSDRAKPVVETNKTKEAGSVFETGKDSNRSIFKFDAFKNPQLSNDGIKKKECSLFKLDRTQNVSNVIKNKDSKLSEYYVKSKVMENRLRQRMDEFVCIFNQIMEETLTGVLEKLSPAVLKYMLPPWSLYEALQCTKNVYKDHAFVTSIVDELCGFLYESDYRAGKFKKNITPNEFIKVYGCGILLVKYLKNILDHSIILSDAEESLLSILKQIEDPMIDSNDPLVRIPSVSKTDDKEPRQNFIKKRSVIVNYLKKHYTSWQAYDETENVKMKIIRTYGRDLNLLKLHEKDGNKGIEKIADATEDLATKHVDVVAKNHNATNDVEALVQEAKSKDTVTKNVVTNKTETKIKPMVVKTAEKLENLQKNSNIKPIDGNDALKEIENAKSKIKSDSGRPKQTKRTELECKEAKYVQKEKFKIDSSMLLVKITVPNDYNERLQRNSEIKDNARKKTDNLITSKDKLTKDYTAIDKNVEVTPKPNIKPINTQKDKQTDQTIENRSKSIGMGKENGPKIVRNVHLIEEFEKRLQNKKKFDELEYSSDVSNYSDTNDCVNKNDEENAKDISKLDNIIAKDYNNRSNNDKYVQINEKIDRKSEKDDTTNDSGFGNESPRIYSVVKSFSAELEGSLEVIRTFVDGCLQELRKGKLRETKDLFRLKVREANFFITKIIARLKKLLQRENEGSGQKDVSKNTQTIERCLEQSQILQRTLNMMLSATDEVGLTDLNSSMSLNLSS